MYSVVLMMALTSGGDVPALGHHGCCGGGYGCSGGSCHGSKHHRGHGCCGGSYGGCYGNSCCGGGHKHHRRQSCCGGCYGGSYGYSCGGGYYGGGMGVGCAGGMGGMGTQIVPGNIVPATPAKPANPKKTSLEDSAPATLVVTVPADARLSIDGEVTSSTSTQRVFVSPALSFGHEYHYTLQAEFQKDGKTVKVSKDVAITAGNETRVSLGGNSSVEVASR